MIYLFTGDFPNGHDNTIVLFISTQFLGVCGDSVCIKPWFHCRPIHEVFRQTGKSATKWPLMALMINHHGFGAAQVLITSVFS
jgi:hypothetical protein